MKCIYSNIVRVTSNVTYIVYHNLGSSNCDKCDTEFNCSDVPVSESCCDEYEININDEDEEKK